MDFSGIARLQADSSDAVLFEIIKYHQIDTSSMPFRRTPHLMLLFACHAAVLAQSEPITRTTVTVSKGGIESARIMFPVGEKRQFDFKADSVTEDAKTGIVHAHGNVHIAVTEPGGATSTITGDDVFVNSEEISPDMQRALADLEAMGSSDQQYRKDVSADAEATTALMALQAPIDAANLQRLREIIGKFGWPGVHFAGARGAQNAFMVLQHADSAAQKEFVPILRKAVARSEARGDHLAMLEDRLLVNDGLPQKYGTQLKSIAPLQLYPVADRKNLDRRRKAVGLPPINDYLAQFRRSVKQSP